MAQAALPFSLLQLSDWLAHGGMAAGVPHGCDCTALCLLQTSRLQMRMHHLCLLTLGDWLCL